MVVGWYLFLEEGFFLHEKDSGFFWGGEMEVGQFFCGFCFVLSLKRSVFNSNGFKIVLAVADSKVYFCVF